MRPPLCRPSRNGGFGALCVLLARPPDALPELQSGRAKIPEARLEAIIDLPAEMLRVMSPSAEVQGHSPEQRVTVARKKNVRISELRPIGNYAVRIVFDDKHDTGLFTWDYLRTLGREKESRWAEYLAEMEKKGLSRG